jgi:lipid A 3-O-deacylase
MAKLKPWFLICFLFSGTTTVGAQNFKNEFGFKSENDSYLLNKQDRYYTNGLFVYFRHAASQKKLGKKYKKLIYEFSGGQKIYNPISGYRPNPVKQDRPFAAYLYLGANASYYYKNESVLKTGVDIGTIGQKALGKELQVFLHKMVGLYEVDGWQYQIKNDFAFNLYAQYTNLLFRNADKNLDFSLESAANLGTTFSSLGLGILARTGNINQLFNSVSTNSRIQNKAEIDKPKTEFFFYVKPQLSIVAYDATVSGSMFNNDSEVTFNTKPLVFAQQLGINYSTSQFTIDYSLFFKSREIKSTAIAHQYGSISVLYRF